MSAWPPLGKYANQPIFGLIGILSFRNSSNDLIHLQNKFYNCVSVDTKPNSYYRPDCSLADSEKKLFWIIIAALELHWTTGNRYSLFFLVVHLQCNHLMSSLVFNRCCHGDGFFAWKQILFYMELLNFYWNSTEMNWGWTNRRITLPWYLINATEGSRCGWYLET